jgi:imidazolonepropionase-like amidohydrolase
MKIMADSYPVSNLFPHRHFIVSIKVDRFVLFLTTLLMTMAAVGQETESVAVTSVNLIDVETGQIIPNTTVVIQGDQIVSVGNPANISPPESAEIVDGSGGFLIPGLWDVHVHLSYQRESALLALVANGVTYVRDTGSNLSEIEAWRGQIASGEIDGPEILRAGPILNDREFNIYQLRVANAAEARTAVRTLHKVGVDFIKLHRRTSREAYFAIADECRKLGLPFVGHIPMTVTPLEASNAGQATIEHSETLFEGTFMATVTGDLATAIERWRISDGEPLFQAFVENRTAFTPTLVVWQEVIDALESSEIDPRQQYVSQSARNVADEILRQMSDDADAFVAERKRLLDESAKVVGLANSLGVSILAGTDLAAGFVYPGFSLHDELVMLVEAGLTPLEALQAGTSNPAELFPALEAGTIGPGKRADLLLLDANPLEDIRNTKKIRAVILRGKVLSKTDLDNILARAATFAEEN